MNVEERLDWSQVWSNETLLLAARGGERQAVAVLAHGARPAALYLMRCSRTPGVNWSPFSGDLTVITVSVIIGS